MISYVKNFSSTEQYVTFFFSQKTISMRDISDFTSNFAKTEVKNLQKVPNRGHQNFCSWLYGFGMFVKKNIIAVTLWTQVLVKKISPIESDFVH